MYKNHTAEALKGRKEKETSSKKEEKKKLLLLLLTAIELQLWKEKNTISSH